LACGFNQVVNCFFQDEAKKANITILACENTIKNNKLTKEDMLPNTSYVAVGVAQIIKRQREGYAYVRP